MKRLLFAALIVTTITISAQGKIPYSGGTGTSEDPYRISTASDVVELAAATDDYDANFILTADIDLSTAGIFTTAVIARDTDNSDWEFQGSAFTGVFDGNGHTISFMTIFPAGEGNDFLGLFGYIYGGRIKNLSLENVRIIGADTSVYIGGLAGESRNGVIANCSSSGEVRGGASCEAIGGLVGRSLFCDIRNCSTSGTVAGKYNVGGLAGINGIGAEISECFSDSDVTGADNSTRVGGLVGENYAGSNISNSYSSCVIMCGSNSMYIGGLAGSNGSDSSIINCYFDGIVAPGDNLSYAGYLLGSNTQSLMSGCYFVDPKYGPDNGLGTPLTTEQMMQQASFAGWDFAGETKNGKEDIWVIQEGIDYPRVIWAKVLKCTVTAGKDNKDKISVSGQLDTGANHCFTNGNVIKIAIQSDHMNDYFVPIFDINDKTFKKGKFRYSGTENGVKRSFKYDTKTRIFTLSASGVDLSGLDCPVMMHIWVGGYHRTVELGEEIVNGKKPAPMILLMGYADALRVDSLKVKRSTKPNGDQLSVTGALALKNGTADMSNSAFYLWIDDGVGQGLSFSVPAGKFIPAGNGFSYSGPTDEGSIVTAKFDFAKCTFTLNLKNTDILVEPLPAEFRITFGTFDEGVNVIMP